MPGAVGLVGGGSANRTGKAAARDFTVAKHGGFARFWRETPCARRRSEKGG